MKKTRMPQSYVLSFAFSKGENIFLLTKWKF